MKAIKYKYIQIINLIYTQNQWGVAIQENTVTRLKLAMR